MLWFRHVATVRNEELLLEGPPALDSPAISAPAESGAAVKSGTVNTPIVRLQPQLSTHGIKHPLCTHDNGNNHSIKCNYL